MSDTKLMNYITTDFQTKSDMKVGEIEWKNIVDKKFEKFKKAGAVRQTLKLIFVMCSLPNGSIKMKKLL